LFRRKEIRMDSRNDICLHHQLTLLSASTRHLYLSSMDDCAFLNTFSLIWLHTVTHPFLKTSLPLRLVALGQHTVRTAGSSSTFHLCLAFPSLAYRRLVVLFPSDYQISLESHAHLGQFLAINGRFNFQSEGTRNNHKISIMDQK